MKSPIRIANPLTDGRDAAMGIKTHSNFDIGGSEREKAMFRFGDTGFAGNFADGASGCGADPSLSARAEGV